MLVQLTQFLRWTKAKDRQFNVGPIWRNTTNESQGLLSQNAFNQDPHIVNSLWRR